MGQVAIGGADRRAAASARGSGEPRSGWPGHYLRALAAELSSAQLSSTRLDSTRLNSTHRALWPNSRLRARKDRRGRLAQLVQASKLPPESVAARELEWWELRFTTCLRHRRARSRPPSCFPATGWLPLAPGAANEGGSGLAPTLEGNLLPSRSSISRWLIVKFLPACAAARWTQPAFWRLLGWAGRAFGWAAWRDRLVVPLPLPLPLPLLSLSGASLARRESATPRRAGTPVRAARDGRRSCNRSGAGMRQMGLLLRLRPANGGRGLRSRLQAAAATGEHRWPTGAAPRAKAARSASSPPPIN